ncbi:MAG: hypothetical protein LC118_09460 [Dehalococcoidia bacterium]|nr:hypothetical protein [Dehalococcoidia bacterium]
MELIARAEATPIPYWVPQVPFDDSREMWRAAHAASGIKTVADFYSRRNLFALAALRHAILEESDARLRDALLFAFTAMVNRASKRYQWNAKRPTNVMTGTLYVSSLRYEWNVWSLFHRKARDVCPATRAPWHPGRAVCGPVVRPSAASTIPDGADFVSPTHLSANIFYADSSLLWRRGWVGSPTTGRRWWSTFSGPLMRAGNHWTTTRV